MIRLIALDLDDTLLMPDCTIPSDVISVLQRADSQYGVRIVIATGRIYPSAKYTRSSSAQSLTSSVTTAR